MERVIAALGKFASRFAYGFVFVVVLPVALVAWAQAVRGVVRLDMPYWPMAGMAIAAAGLATMLWGMLSLWVYGGGLPMNAFPPPRLVTRGSYALVSHPIYGGFVMVCGGVSIWARSASGLWLVTPAVALGCAALVLGYEWPDLRERFGTPASGAADARPSFTEGLRAAIAVLLPWLAGYGSVWIMGRQAGAFSTSLSFEWRIPVLEWTELVYASCYVVVLLAPFLIRRRDVLAEFVRRGAAAIFLALSTYLLLPVFVEPRPFVPSTIFAPMLQTERTPWAGACSFPSFHVMWALIAASALGRGGRARRLIWWAWGAAVAVSCIATGMHSIADVLAGVAAFYAVVKMPAIWRALLGWAERVANSWREWRFGGVRIINHGGYAGLAAFVGVLVTCSLLPRGGGLVIGGTFLCVVVGAALWAQWVEGSPALLRPLGFYGGMIGALAGALLAPLAGIDPWLALAALTVAAPWIQALGRVRCLVQGCCHGREARSVEGIRYWHPSTRVCRLAHLKQIPIHATQLYSILWNVWSGLMLLRLLSLGVSSTMVAGMYLILNGAGRFVEEAYRGEPQTKVVFGLRLYQWIAAANVVAGAVVTTIDASPLPRAPHLRPETWLVAAACGALMWFVSGVDFPGSSRRFARLT